MCGIVGLFAKSPEIKAQLGCHLSAMLVEMSDRGPDSAGGTIENFNEKGNPRDVVQRFAFDNCESSHALRHTRMATESAVTTEHSHPFSSGLDLCLVRNGSLSNWIPGRRD